jgi:UDP-N-acetylmuramoyl-tripeptide--D-alanyl-D-alanine ligase
VGKTSAKDAAYTAIRGARHARKNEKTLNSDIGVPLTIIGAQNAWESVSGWVSVFIAGIRCLLGRCEYPKLLVLEVGIDHPGDMQRIARWIRPDTVVFTGVPDLPTHGAYFESADAVLEEKAYLVRYMDPKGTLIVNGDDARAKKLAHPGRIITYGLGSENALRATDIEPQIAQGEPYGKDGGLVLWYKGLRFRVNHGSTAVPVEIRGALGNAQVLSVLAGFAVGISEGMDLVGIGKSFAEHVTPPGRMRLLNGLTGTTIIDDSYNASPAAALVALDTLKELPVEGRRIAALGDMRELGENSRKAHEMIGKRAAEVADLIITVGEESRVLAQAALDAGLKQDKLRSYGYGESEKAGKDLARLLKPGDVVLVKGSQNMIRMERLVKEIMAEPERAPDLLVRQEPEWLTIP